jgi:hypothetical protein
MAFAFNPFTGNFDLKGSGGGGASYIDGEVQNFSALPTANPPAVDSAYLVREAEGTWLLGRKPAGIYIRTASTGVRADDWTHAGAFPDVFNDANFVLYDNGDSTKNLAFQLSGITTGTTRTLTVPDKSGTIARTEDFAAPPAIGNTTAAAGTFTTLSASDTFSATAQARFGTGTGNVALRRGDGVTFFSGNYNTFFDCQAREFRLGHSGTGGPVSFFLDGNGVIEQRNTTNAQTFRLYNTFTSATNFERLSIGWASNTVSIKPEAGGAGGTVRELHISGLPTSNPGPGILWNDSNTVKVGT